MVAEATKLNVTQPELCNEEVLMGRDRYKIIKADYPYFFTCTINNWFPLFMNPGLVQIILKSLKFLQNEGLIIYAFVIMENHLHLIAQSSELAKDIQRFKSYTATNIVVYLKENFQHPLLRRFNFREDTKHRKHKIWEEGSHPIVLDSYAKMVQKVEYIHNNPVRRGYIDDPVNWINSSARNYFGRVGIIDVITDW
jgi:REP element-mobilizing transposase RayT